MVPRALPSRPRLRLPRGRAADAALAGAVLVLVAVGSLRSLIGDREESWEATALGWALLVAACAALYVCRRHPVPTAAFVLAATIAYYLVSAYDGPLMVAFVIALYTVAAGAGSARRSSWPHSVCCSPEPARCSATTTSTASPCS
ncbi:hypothetical protein R2F25_19780 [Streptomyces sp. UP1A-1]|nr:hypothetical protein [Streptomyces sp. UP1A-1]